MDSLKFIKYGLSAGLTGYCSISQLIDYSTRKFAEASRALETGKELSDKLVFDLPLVGMFAGSVSMGITALGVYEIAKIIKGDKNN